MPAEENKAIVRRLMEESFGGGKPELVDELLVPDFVRYDPYIESGEVRGTQTVKAVKKEGPRPPEPMEVCEGAEPILVAPWSLSVLGELRKLTSGLIERYSWEAAGWFVLTGQPPWVPPLTATGSGPDLVKNHGTITIKAAYWVPEEAVSQLYSSLKAKMKPAPTTSPRRLALVRFVIERSSGMNRWESSKPGGPKDVHVQGLGTPPWRSLLAEWNEEYPQKHEWHYHDVRNFRRDFAEASKSLIGY